MMSRPLRLDIDYTWKTRGEKIPKQINFNAPVKHSESSSVWIVRYDWTCLDLRRRSRPSGFDPSSQMIFEKRAAPLNHLIPVQIGGGLNQKSAAPLCAGSVGTHYAEGRQTVITRHQTTFCGFFGPLSSCHRSQSHCFGESSSVTSWRENWAAQISHTTWTEASVDVQNKKIHPDFPDTTAFLDSFLMSTCPLNDSCRWQMCSSGRDDWEIVGMAVCGRGFIKVWKILWLKKKKEHWCWVVVRRQRRSLPSYVSCVRCRATPPWSVMSLESGLEFTDVEQHSMSCLVITELNVVRVKAITLRVTVKLWIY